MYKKAGPPAQVKIVDEAKGEVEAVFATMDAIDKDGDVTRPGAFGEQKVRISAFNHRSWDDALPVGKGDIREQGNEAIVKSQFFMDTTAGRDHFNVIKELTDLMEWSYGFDVLEKAEGKWPEGDPNGRDVRFLLKQKVHEVAPVILGAGVDTRTLSAKSFKGAISYSKTATVEGAWDGPAMWGNCPAAAAALRAASAWVDPQGNADAKSSYKFIHHMVMANGTVGAANTTGCTAGIAVLNGGRGGTVIPDGDRQGVYSHLAHHLSDAGKEPPPLKSREEIEHNGVSLFDQLAWSVDVLDDVYKRVSEVMAMRLQEGKSLVEGNVTLINEILASSERLRKCVTIEPRVDPIKQEYLQQLRKQAEALIYLTERS